MSRRHYSQRLHGRIDELERELAIVGGAARDAVEETQRAHLRFLRERELRLRAEDALCMERERSAELSKKAALWERNGHDLHAELEKLHDLSRAHDAALKKVKELEKKLNIRKGTEDAYGINTPSSKQVFKRNSSAENRAKRGGAKVGHPGHGRRDFSTGEADMTVENAILAPNCCDNPALRKLGTVSQVITNFVPMRLETILYINEKSACRNCGSTVVAPIPEVQPGAMYSNPAVAQMLAECYFHQTPIGQAARRFGVNKGTLLGIAHRVADSFTETFLFLIQEARRCVFLHADETGWSMDGKRAYAWLFANDFFRIFLFRESRAAAEAQEVLGKDKLDLILIIDRYIGYNPLKVQRQFCFAHLLRDVKKLMLEFPDDQQIKSFCDDLIPHLRAAMKLQSKKLPPHEHQSTAEKLKSDIMEICNAPSNDPGIQHIQNIFREQEHRLFHWVENPEIPCENNFAERNLRPIVISRKTSFGCQSERGMKTREILMTILHTAACRNRDPVEFLTSALNKLTLDPGADLSQLFA